MSAPANPFAFPSPDDGRPSDGYGMTLRDWFAGQALIGIATKGMPSSLGGDLERYLLASGTTAYAYADAMLAARGDA